jgi:hypothetical protein
MTTSTTKASTNWRDWPTTTRVIVGLGALLAALVVAFLYAPR